MTSYSIKGKPKSKEAVGIFQRLKNMEKEWEVKREKAKQEKIKLGVGYDATRTFLKQNPKITEQILKEIRKKFAEQA